MTIYCDVMLGKLTKYLRILGLDTIYLWKPRDFHSIPRNAANLRILLTRRRGVVAHVPVVEVHFDSPIEQLREILPLIKPHLKPTGFMTRCLRCNAVLEEIDRSSAEGLVPEFIFHSRRNFRRCPACSRIFWSGSHAERMRSFLRQILEDGTS